MAAGLLDSAVIDPAEPGLNAGIEKRQQRALRIFGASTVKRS
jgi:hypothetical protein